jgi:hypothetical protein
LLKQAGVGVPAARDAALVAGPCSNPVGQAEEHLFPVIGLVRVIAAVCGFFVQRLFDRRSLWLAQTIGERIVEDIEKIGAPCLDDEFDRFAFVRRPLRDGGDEIVQLAGRCFDALILPR